MPRCIGCGSPHLVIAGVARALRPRGRFVGELGGHGNVAAIATAMRAVGAARGGDPALVAPWFFPTAEEYGELLAAGGFSVKEIALVPRPTPLKTGMEGWLRTFGRSFFDQFPEPERTEVVGEVVDLLRPSLCDSHGGWTADHIQAPLLCRARGLMRAATPMPHSWSRRLRLKERTGAIVKGPVQKVCGMMQRLSGRASGLDRRGLPCS